MKYGNSTTQTALTEDRQNEMKAAVGVRTKRGLGAAAMLANVIAWAGGDTTPIVPVGDHNPTTFAALQTALSTATAGQRVRIPPRTTITMTAKLSVPIGVSIVGGGGVVIVSGFVPASPTATTEALFQLVSGNEGASGAQSIDGLTFSGNNFQAAAAVYVKARSNVKVRNCQFTEFNYNAVTFNGRADETDGPATTKATGNGVYNCVGVGCCTWIGSKVQPYGYASGIIQFGSQVGFELKDSIITAKGRGATNNGYGVKLYRLGYNDLTVIDNCTIRKDVDDGTAGNFGFCIESWNDRALTIKNCTLEGWPDINGATKGSYAFGVMFQGNVCGTGITPTLAATAAVCGIELECGSPDGGAPCSDVHVVGNIFKAVKFAVYVYQKSGTGTQRFTNVVIANNLCIDTRINETIAGANEGGTQNWRVLKNTVRKTASGPYMYAGVKVPHVGNNSDWFIERNVIVGSAVGPVVQETPVGGTTTNVVVADNIFFNSGNSDTPLFATAPTQYAPARNRSTDPLWDATDPMGGRHAYSGAVGSDELVIEN